MSRFVSESKAFLHPLDLKPSPFILPTILLVQTSQHICFQDVELSVLEDRMIFMDAKFRKDFVFAHYNKTM